MDGFEVTRRVRQDNTHRLLPIILVTVLRETEDRVKGIEAGCDDFISKPIDKTELLARVRSLLKVKAYNDLLSSYRNELESEVTRRTEQLKQALKNLQRDIIERKRVEEALRESEEKFRVLADSTPAAVMLYQDDRWIYANKAAEIICGYSEKELLSMNFWNIVHPDFKPLIQEHGRMRQQGNETTIRYEFKIITKDGTQKWVDLSGASTMLQGRPAGIITVLDVTDRKKAEETLKESENKYRLLADNVHDVIFVLDMNLNYTYVSPSTKFLRGYEPDEVMKQPPSKALTPSSWDLVKKTIADAVELGKTEHREINIFPPLELEMIRKDGTTIFTEVKASVIRDENRKPVGILGVTRDISERKRAEEALQDSEEQYRLVVENAKESIFIIQDIKIVFVNRAVIGMVGYSKETLTSKPFTDFIHPDDLNMVVDHHIRRIKGDEVPPVYSFRVIGQDGTVIWCELNAAVIQWKGKPATLAFLTNITEGSSRLLVPPFRSWYPL
jgi:PAS domain S-box-containing protein